MTVLENMNLTGQFLIAMPAMLDPHFSKSVTFICAHNEDGAMGIVINRPIQVTIDALLQQIDLTCPSSSLASQPVFYGGPVQTDRGFVLHSPSIEFNTTVAVNEAVALTTSKDILTRIAHQQGPEKILIALGYAGWSPGQLEDEMLNNAWLSFKPTQLDDLSTLIFDLPYQEKLAKAMALVGVDFASLSEVAGHA